jgi:acyl-[acyl-carrier-protein]-phospholipid O-acyltransferase/long-chain-fatty-acid--[acyl-carrier-protein] ligase
LDTLASRFVHTAKRRWTAPCVADSTGRELTFGRALVGRLLLARSIRRRVPGGGAVGLLLPASVGGALTNIAATIAGCVPVNLNFTAGREAMAAAIDRCRITTVITSRAFLSKAGIASTPDMVYLEDVLQATSAFARLIALIAARLLPAPLIDRLLPASATPTSCLACCLSFIRSAIPSRSGCR